MSLARALGALLDKTLALNLWDEAEEHSSLRGRAYLAEEFLQEAGGTLAKPLATQNTKTAGTVVTDFVSGGLNGQYNLALDATNELQSATLYCADKLYVIAGTGAVLPGLATGKTLQGPRFQARVSITADVTGAGGTLKTGDRIVIGLGGTRNATLASMTKFAWFAFRGTKPSGVTDTHTVLFESKDGTTTNTSQISTVKYVEGQLHLFEIDARNLADVAFIFDGVRINAAKSIDVTGWASAAAKLQPFIEVAKAAAANGDHSVLIDFVEVGWARG